VTSPWGGWLPYEELEFQLQWIYQADLRAETTIANQKWDNLLRQGRRYPGGDFGDPTKYGPAPWVGKWATYTIPLADPASLNQLYKFLHPRPDRIVEHLMVRGQRRVRTVTGTATQNRSSHNWPAIRFDEWQAFFWQALFMAGFSVSNAFWCSGPSTSWQPRCCRHSRQAIGYAGAVSRPRTP